MMFTGLLVFGIGFYLYIVRQSECPYRRSNMLYVIVSLSVLTVFYAVCFQWYKNRDKCEGIQRSKLIKAPSLDSNYKSFNPSITTLNGQIYIYVRASLDHGYANMYRVFNPSIIMNHRMNKCIFGVLNRETLEVENYRVLDLPDSEATVGAMDLRLLTHQNRIYGIGNTNFGKFLQGNSMYLVELTPQLEVIRNFLIKPSFDADQIQKNWMPFFVGNSLRFVYRVHPLVILQLNFESRVAHPLNEVVSDYSLPIEIPGKLNGGPPLLKVGEVYLGLAHTKNPYQHVFFLMSVDLPYRIVGISELFCFDQEVLECPYVQFATGLCYWDSNNVAISFGESDDECRLIIYPLNEIFTMIKRLKT